MSSMNAMQKLLRRSELAALAAALLVLGATRSIAQQDLPRATPETVGVSSPRLQRIGEAIQRHIEEHHIAGAVSLVARKGFVVHYEAHGVKDIESRKPMTRDAIFKMASSTKPVTGVAIMMLVEEGKIHLADPVSRFIPEFKEMKVAVEKEGSSEIELVKATGRSRSATCSRTGRVCSAAGRAPKQCAKDLLRPSQPEETLARYIPRLATIPLDFQPGTKWRYSGLAGIDTLSRIVEIASGQSYDEFLRKRIFEPLGMNDTFFVVPDDRQERVATIYRSTDKGLEKNPLQLRFPKTYFSGAGGLSSTAADYFRFGQMLLNRGSSMASNCSAPGASPSTASNQVGDMFEGQSGRPKGMGFGFTVEVVQDSIAAGTFRSDGSFGWDGAFGTHFWVDPEQQLVAVLMIQTSVGRQIHRDFETAVMQAIVD